MSLIDPLKAFVDGIPKMEETSIFASLTIGGRGRSIIENGTIISEKSVKVNFLGFNEKTQSFTTNWSEIAGPHTAGNEPEGFGMTSISIEVNASYVPKVTITFVDIRGASLFNVGANSKYAALFQFPPPEYTLKIKGYFGKSLTYGLHMIKQNSKFNSKTGNFEITAEFVAITFAPLADIPVAYIKAAPFMDNSNNIDPQAGSVDTFYELVNASRVLNKNIEGLKQGGDFEEFTKLGDEIEVMKEDVQILKNFDYLKQTYESNVFNSKVEIIEITSNLLGDEFKVFTDKKGEFKNDSFKITGSLEALGNASINEAREQILKFIKSELSNENKDIISKENIKIIRDKDQHFNLTGKTSNANLVLTIRNLNIQTIRKKIEKIEKKRRVLCDNITKDIEEQSKMALTFRPTIYNIFKIICDDTDTFIRLLKQTSLDAQKDTSISSFITNNVPDAKVSDEIKPSGISRYAWPEVIKNRDGKKVRIYPGENINFINMPEVKFVEKFIEASTEIAKNAQIQRGLDSTDDEGAREWTPLGPFEEISLATGTDYDDNKTSVANIIGTLVKRAQIIINWNLRHSTLEKKVSTKEVVVSILGLEDFVKEDISGLLLIDSLGVLEGQNILHDIVDENILLLLKEISKKKNIDDILNISDDTLNPLNLYNNSTPKINFNHSGEEDGNFRSYKYVNETAITSASKIENSVPNFDSPQTLKKGIKDIKDAAENQDFVSWLSGLFGNNIDIQINDENKIIYKDTRDNDSESSWFEGNLSEFSFPPLEDFDKIDKADKNINYSNTILKPLFIGGDFVPGKSSPVETFLYNLFNPFSSLSNTSGANLGGAKPIRFDDNRIKIKTLKDIIEEREILFPSIIEIPYIVLVYQGWLLGVINNNANFTLKDLKMILREQGITEDDENYFKDLPKIIKDQLIEQYNDFKNNIFPKIRNKIIKNINSNILELNDNQFQQDINDIDNWGKPKPGIKAEDAWWEDLMKRKYIFLGLPLLLAKPEVRNKELKNNILDINPLDRRGKVEQLIKSALKFLGTKIDDRIKDIEKIEKDIESQLKDPNIKLSFYNSFKSINDRWLSGGFSPFDGKNSKLISKFSFVDRAMRDIGVTPKNNNKDNFERANEIIDGESVIIKFEKIEDTVENNDMSLLTLIDQLLIDNKFMFFPLQNFMLFDNNNWSDNNDNIKNVFGINLPTDIDNESPKFLCLYIDSTSSFLDNQPGKDIFQDNGAEIKEIIAEESSDEKGLKVNAFVVKYGHPHQSMFKDISLDQAEFKETIESIKILDKISQIGSEDTSAKTILKGQNLFNTYEQRSYSCEVEMLGNAMIQPTQYFQLENVPMFHGAYMIINVSHNITPNQMTTKFKGVRIPKNSLPLVTDYATAVGFNLCVDSSVEGTTSTKITDQIKGVIDPKKITESDGLYIQNGQLYYVIEPQKGIAGDKLLEFMNDLQKHLGNKATLGNNGITRDLESVVAGGPSRSKTSKHGAGLAIDLLISTSDVDYKKLGWPAANKELVKNKTLMIEINKFVLFDSRYKDLIKWGGHFKLGIKEQIIPSLSVRIDEIHHFEIKDEKIEQFFKDAHKNKMKKLGIKIPKAQKDLALLYSYPFDSKPYSKEKFNEQIINSETEGDGIDYNKTG